MSWFAPYSMSAIPAPVLTTARLSMRGPRIEDFEHSAAFYTSERSAHIGGPLDEAAAWRLFAGDCGSWALFGFGWWTVEHEGAVIGSVGLHHPAHHADLELGWNIYEGAEGKGLAREAAEAARDWQRVNLPGRRLVSYIDRQNVRSIALAERLGAREIGTPDHDPLCGTWLHPEGSA